MTTPYIEITISAELREECIALFGRIRIFDTPDSLRAFTVINDKLKVIAKSCVPKSNELDHSRLLTSLLETRIPTREPVLFILLDALASEYKEQDIGGDCKRLKEKITKETSSSAEDPQDIGIAKKITVQNASPFGTNAQHWFTEAGSNVAEIAFRIALAVFNGTPLDVIEDAQADLVKRLSPIASTTSLPETPPPFTLPVPLHERLKAANAVETNPQPPDWKTLVQIDQNLATEALIYVWRNFREWHSLLIGWLTSYAANRPIDVRTRAAIAAGIIASVDYGSVRDNLFYHWLQIESRQAEFRAALGMAFQIIIRDKRWSEEVQSLLRKWSQSKVPAERWAAARIYMYVGTYCNSVSEVIMHWRNIANSEMIALDIPISGEIYLRLSNPLHMSLIDAIMRFFDSIIKLSEKEQRRLFAGALEGVRQWIAADSNNKELGGGLNFGVFLFLSLAGFSAQEGQSTPLLFSLVDIAPTLSDYRKNLAEILCPMLLKAATVGEIKDLLQEWLRRVDSLKNNPDAYEIGISKVKTLLTDIIAVDQTGRMRRILLAYLRDWQKIGAAYQVRTLLEN